MLKARPRSCKGPPPRYCNRDRPDRFENWWNSNCTNCRGLIPSRGPVGWYALSEFESSKLTGACGKLASMLVGCFAYRPEFVWQYDGSLALPKGAASDGFVVSIDGAL